MGLTPSERVTLPVGLEIDDVRYREVIIDEMTGYDEENISSPKHRNNGAKAITSLLRRCIQAIPGLIDKKSHPNELIPAKYVRKMYTVDRDFLFLAIRTLGMEPEFDMDVRCPACNDSSDHTVELPELDVLEWDEADPPELHIELPKGIRDHEGNEHRDVRWRFPTGEDQERLASVQKNKMMTTLIATCMRVPGLDDSVDPEMVRRMRTRDRMFLMNSVRAMSPGVDLRTDHYCSMCDHEWEGDIDLARFFSMESAGTQETTPVGSRGRKRKKRA